MSEYFSSESEQWFASARKRIADYRAKQETAPKGGLSPLDLARRIYEILERGRPSDEFKPGEDY